MMPGFAGNILRATVVVFAFTAAGCESMKNLNMGTLFGAGAGAAIGSQIGSGKGNLVAMAIGTLAGAWVGTEIANKLDHSDKMHAERAAQTALERNDTGAATPWQNLKTESSGTFKPTSNPKMIDEKRCRTFIQTVTIEGKETVATGTACQKNKNDMWRIVSYDN
ncbi:MAG: glycine zipper 2TM domain-containing protein [Parcubacteria group bacterium]|nr:glycine zipper 2TM domain-containing protein [Parcubacteria group bacterium]